MTDETVLLRTTEMINVQLNDGMQRSFMSHFTPLLARLMGQYCLLAGVCRLLSSVTLPAGRRAGAGRVGNRAADTARRASTVTSR